MVNPDGNSPPATMPDNGVAVDAGLNVETPAHTGGDDVTVVVPVVVVGAALAIGRIIHAPGVVFNPPTLMVGPAHAELVGEGDVGA